MYLLDANIFIEANDRYYGMDFAPGFWDWIFKAHGAGLLFSIDAVRDEIEGRGDKLSEWSKLLLPQEFYISPTARTAVYLQELSTWAVGRSQYTENARRTFLSSADYYLVAQAKELGFCIVTHEKSAPDSKTIIKIPEACHGIGVKYSGPWDVLRNGGARFHLSDEQLRGGDEA